MPAPKGERNPGEVVLRAPRGAMREWCPRCGRKGLLCLGALGAKRRDRAGYNTCGHCRLSFIVSDADLEAIRAARSHRLGHVTPDDGDRVDRVSVLGRAGDSERRLVWRGGVGGGGHRTSRLRWSCDTSTEAERGSDDRREIAAIRVT